MPRFFIGNKQQSWRLVFVFGSRLRGGTPMLLHVTLSSALSLTYECFEVHIHIIFAVRNGRKKNLETGIGGRWGDIVGGV